MIKSLYNGMTGLKSFQTGMDVLANNISNVNTTAYKGKVAKFDNLLSQTIAEAGGANDTSSSRNPKQVGLGVKVSATQQNMYKAGAVEETGYEWDMRINGETYFIINDGKQNYYTKDGTFGIDANGDLVTRSGGLYVSGWMSSDGATVNRSGAVGRIHVQQEENTNGPLYLMIQGSIDGRDAELANVDGGDTVSFRISGKDGNLYTCTFAFTNSETDTTGRTLNLQLKSLTNSSGEAVEIAENPTITLTYGEDGTLASAGGAANGRVSLNLPQEIVGQGGVFVDLSKTSLLYRENGIVANADHNSVTEVSGSAMYGDNLGPTGKLLNYRTDENGIIYANYQGGERVIGQIAVAKFQNQSGLTSAGGSLFEASMNSGNVEYLAATEVEQGGIYAGQLEMSNVDLSEEFTNMIIMQRAFQANSKVVTTSDQMLETARDLKR